MWNKNENTVRCANTLFSTIEKKTKGNFLKYIVDTAYIRW